MISDLRTRVRLYQPVRTPDGGGGFTQSWSDAGPVWAAVRTDQPGEEVRADGQVARARYQVRLRFRADVAAGWRITLPGDVSLRVIACIDPQADRRWLDCLCEEDRL